MIIVMIIIMKNIVIVIFFAFIYQVYVGVPRDPFLGEQEIQGNI